LGESNVGKEASSSSTRKRKSEDMGKPEGTAGASGSKKRYT
jgi:hypothetical protein